MQKKMLSMAAKSLTLNVKFLWVPKISKGKDLTWRL